MKDIINAFCASVAVVVLVFCFMENANVETSILRAMVSFASIFVMGYGAYLIFKVQINTNSYKPEAKNDNDEQEQNKKAHAEA